MVKAEVTKPFGTSVRAWRKRRGLSQETLAERAGLHRTYVCDVERGARNLSLESIDKLAHALEVSVTTLFSYSPEHDAEKCAAASFGNYLLVDILLVEDRDDDVALTIRALENAKITNCIHVVRDGPAALDFLFCKGAYAHREKLAAPKLILLDLGLPKIDGLEILRRIKSDPDTRSIPVIVLTASAHDRDFVASKQLGASGYIVKPVDFQNLSKVTPLLNLQWALVKPTSPTKA